MGWGWGGAISKIIEKIERASFEGADRESSGGERRVGAHAKVCRVRRVVIHLFAF